MAALEGLVIAYIAVAKVVARQADGVMGEGDLGVDAEEPQHGGGDFHVVVEEVVPSFLEEGA